MPESWIKLRSDLENDPRVHRMAAHIAKTAPEYFLRQQARDLFGSVTESVTRNALRDVTVMGLVRIWITANEHTTNGTFHHATLDYLDDLARIPGFGAAMQLVGWAVYNDVNATVTLPNFTEHNAPDKNGQRSQTAAARRAQRHRDKLKAAAQNQLPDPPVTTAINEVNPVNTVTERDDVTSRSVTPTVTRDVTPSISISSSISESKSESEPEIQNGTTDLAVLQTAKARLNRLRGSWAKLPHWSAEEEAALFAALPNLRAMEPQDWAILAFWLRWAHSKANNESRDPVRVTSRRHAFVTDLAANLDRATTHWKQCGCPRLNPDGTKATTAPVKPAPQSQEPALPPAQNAAAFLGLLKANGAQLPPKVATQPEAA